MKVSFDIKCSDWSNTPAYRVWINGEFMLERDFVIPSNEFSHYNFKAFLDAEKADVVIESVTPDVTFSISNLELTNENQ